jgi:hypothetical protein
MGYIQLIIAIGVAIGGYAFGHSSATKTGELKVAAVQKQMTAEREKLKEDFDKERKVFNTERQGWIAERAEMNASSLRALQKAHADAANKEANIRAGFAASEKAYKKRIKELEDAKKEADRRIDDNTIAGGLWVTVEGGSCSAHPSRGESGGAADMSASSGSAPGPSGSLQCRLTRPFAKALVEIVAEGDARTALLNKCIGSLSAQVSALNQLNQNPSSPTGQMNPVDQTHQTHQTHQTDKGEK